MAQDDYYYEIQLTNKQLVFYFMAGASGLILSFLAGVMVGRGVEGSALGAVETRPVSEERVVAEQSPARGGGDAGAERLQLSAAARVRQARGGAREEGRRRAAARRRRRHGPPSPTARRAARSQTPTRCRPSRRRGPTSTRCRHDARDARSAPRDDSRAGAAAGAKRGPLPKAQPTTAAGFGIQVGAFKDKASADTVVKSLKRRGFPAYTVAPGGEERRPLHGARRHLPRSRRRRGRAGPPERRQVQALHHQAVA